jgi:hypothetical protein
MANWAYVAATFGLTWFVIVAYTLFLTRLTRRASAALLQAERSRASAGEFR